MKNKIVEKLFSYGTLQYPAVQLATFGRKLDGTPDILQGYCLSTLQINDPSVVSISGATTHPILIYTGNKADEIRGVVFNVTWLC